MLGSLPNDSVGSSLTILHWVTAEYLAEHEHSSIRPSIKVEREILKLPIVSVLFDKHMSDRGSIKLCVMYVVQLV